MNQTLQTAHITPSTTLMPALIAWRFFLEDQNRSIHTIKAFVADLTLLAQFLPPDKAIGTITTDDLNQYIQWLEKGRNIPCSPKSLSRRITALKSFFAWLHKNAVITLNPADKVVQQSVISPLPEVLTRNEIELLYEAADNLRQSGKPDARPYVLFGLILETGIKKGNALEWISNILIYLMTKTPVFLLGMPILQTGLKKERSICHMNGCRHTRNMPDNIV